MSLFLTPLKSELGILIQSKNIQNNFNKQRKQELNHQMTKRPHQSAEEFSKLQKRVIYLKLGYKSETIEEGQETLILCNEKSDLDL